MRITSEGQVDVFKNIIEHRPWGYFGLYANNEPCTVKILYVKQGEALSLQVHRNRSQFYYCIDDGFFISYSSEQVPEEIMGDRKALWEFTRAYIVIEHGGEGDMFGFRKRVIHQADYAGKREYGRIFEIAFGENDEKDIIRIEDKYGRE